MKFASMNRPEQQIGMEMAPMIDVVLLLIIFFMATAQFVERSLAELDLPEERGEQREDAGDRGLVINVLDDGGLMVSGQAVDLDELRGIVGTQVQQEAEPQLVQVTVRADRNAPSGQVNRIIELLQEQGVGTARFATEVPE